MKHNDRYNVISIFYCFFVKQEQVLLESQQQNVADDELCKKLEKRSKDFKKKTSCPHDVIMYVPVPVPSTANIGGTYSGVVP